MKKLIRFLWPFLVLLVILAAAFLFFFRVRPDITSGLLTRLGDSMMTSGRYSVAIRYYDWANDLEPDSSETSLKLAGAYEKSGNYSRTENVLVHAIYENPENADLYVALSRVYVNQDKLLDAQRMLDTIANPTVQEALSARRPAAPQVSPAGGRYNDYITVELTYPEGADCYYTTDGQYPSLSNQLYTEPFALPGGETTVCAVAVDQDGLVSPAIYMGYTVAGVIEDVEFHDQALSDAVAEILHTDSSTLKTNDLWTITEFRLPEGVTDARDLALFAGLAKLTIWDAAALDYSFLPELHALRYLELTNCPLRTEDLEMIARCPNLEVLILADCGLSSIAPLSSLNNLRILDLSDNSIGDIQPIAGIASLDELYLGHNGIISLPSLAALTNLRILDLSFNALDSISRLSDCAALTRLNVSNNKLVSVKPAGTLANLVFFNASSNQVRNADALEACTALEVFRMSSNKLTDVDFLASIGTLVEINVDYNDIHTLPKLPAETPLETFSAAHNFLEDLDGLAGLQKLNYVNADYNNISSIDVLQSCPLLAQVNVYGTNVHSGGVLEENGVLVNYTPSFN